MKQLALATLALSLSACTGANSFCNRIGTIPIAPPSDEPETSENRFDTPATVKRVEIHNRVVGGTCGLLPVGPVEP